MFNDHYYYWDPFQPFTPAEPAAPSSPSIGTYTFNFPDPIGDKIDRIRKLASDLMADQGLMLLEALHRAKTMEAGLEQYELELRAEAAKKK